MIDCKAYRWISRFPVRAVTECFFVLFEISGKASTTEAICRSKRVDWLKNEFTAAAANLEGRRGRAISDAAAVDSDIFSVGMISGDEITWLKTGAVGGV